MSSCIYILDLFWAVMHRLSFTEFVQSPAHTVANTHSECTQLSVAKGLRSSCLYSCRNCNVHKMECLESVWTNCSSFLDGFKERRTLRETIPAISPAGWKKTHSVKEISFKTKLILRTRFQSKKFHCFQIFFNEPHMVLGVYWESS